MWFAQGKTGKFAVWIYVYVYIPLYSVHFGLSVELWIFKIGNVMTKLLSKTYHNYQAPPSLTISRSGPEERDDGHIISWSKPSP